MCTRARSGSGPIGLIPSADAPVQPRGHSRTGGRDARAARAMSAYSFYSVQIQRTDDRTEPFACVP